MKLYDYCSFCAKPPYQYYGQWLDRCGEGYIVVSTNGDIENVRECPVCKGFGYVFVKEIVIDAVAT